MIIKIEDIEFRTGARQLTIEQFFALAMQFIQGRFTAYAIDASENEIIVKKVKNDD